MKSILSCASLAAGILTAAPLFAQNPTPAPAAANQPQDLLRGREAKEKAEDAELLQQLESSSDSAVVKSQTRNALKVAPGARGKAMAGGAFPVNVFTRPVGAPRSLLVRTSNPEPKAQAALEEDLAIMSHLLVKAIDDVPGGQIRPVNAMGIELAFPGGSAPIRSLYLDDYGAVFFLGVGFPLVAPPETPKPEKPTGDSAWEDAYQELYGQHQGNLAGEPAEDYSQEKVDRLKDSLLEALKNASNIRGLKPDEFVTLRVTGGVTGGGQPVARKLFKNNSPGGLGGNFELIEQPSLSWRTVLTIRASKSQIDAYAKGRVTAEEFKQHARIAAYADESSPGAFDGMALGGGNTIGRNRF